MNIEKKIGFIGQIPLPLGGVAVINQSFQEFLYVGRLSEKRKYND